MADYVNHLRMVIEGGYVNARTRLAGETWACGVSLMPVLGDTSDIGEISEQFTAEGELSDASDATYSIQSNFKLEGGVNDVNVGSLLATDLLPAVATFFAAQGVTSVSTQVRKVTVYPLKPGLTSKGQPTFKVCQTPYGPAKATGVSKSTAIAVGQTTGNMTPAQLSPVVSLYSLNQSRRGRGRFYLPANGTASIDSDGLLSGTWRTNIANAAKTFIESLSFTEPDLIDIKPVIVGIPGTHYYRVSKIRVGDVFDVQRRRRRQIDETYAEQPVSFGA